MFITLFIFIILALIYFSLASLKLRLKFDDAAKHIDLSYTFIRFRILFDDMTGRLYVAGIRLNKFDLKDIAFAERCKKKRLKEETIDKKMRKREKLKKSIWSNITNLKQIIYYLKKLYHPISNIKIKYLNIDISDGFSDPYQTGQLFAVYSTISGIFPKLKSHINFKPDFSADNIKISGEGLVKLRLCHILLPILQILADKIFGMARTPFLRLKKGTSYV